MKFFTYTYVMLAAEASNPLPNDSELNDLPLSYPQMRAIFSVFF